jgi:hypothetical protein
MTEREVRRATIDQELQRIERKVREAQKMGERQREDYLYLSCLYGSWKALCWVLSDEYLRGGPGEHLRPSRVFDRPPPTDTQSESP